MNPLPTAFPRWLNGRIGRFLASPHGMGLAFALTATALTAAYVFLCTPYTEFLYSDMAAFWRRAAARLSGEAFSVRQYMAWPPAYHIFLAEFFRLLRNLGLLAEMKLEVAMALNMSAFGVSVYAFHQLAEKWFERRAWALTATTLYAFGFPSLYFQAFLLSENLACPLLVIATWLFTRREGWSGTVVAALVLGAAVVIRPAFGPFGLAFVAYFLAKYRWSPAFFLRSAIFSLVFFGVVALAVRENMRISQGKLTSLSANAGLDFFIAMSHLHRVDLNHEGYHWFVIVPSLSYRPGLGSYSTTIPFYNQSHYFKLGWIAIQRNPLVLVDNVGHVRNLFFSRMLPSRRDAPGFTFWMPFYDWLKFLAFLSCGFYFWLWRRLGDRLPVFVLLSGMPLITMLLVYLFTGEPRYSYAIIFCFYLLGLKTAEIILPEWQRWGRPAACFAAFLGALALGTQIYQKWNTPGPPSVQIGVYPPFIPDSQDLPEQQQQLTVTRLRFPYQRHTGLRHAYRKHAPIQTPSRIIAGTQVRGPENGITVHLEIFSQYPIEVWSNEELLQREEQPDFFRPVTLPLYLDSTPRHIRIVCDFAPGPGGLSVQYSVPDEELPYRYPWGVSSPWLTFTSIQDLIAAEAQPPP
jgi:hypothetical protein